MKNKQPKPTIAGASAVQNDPLLRIRFILLILAPLVLLVLFLSPASKLFAAEDNEFAGERIVHLLQDTEQSTTRGISTY